LADWLRAGADGGRPTNPASEGEMACARDLKRKAGPAGSAVIRRLGGRSERMLTPSSLISQSFKRLLFSFTEG
jgi:hypothetical protein